MRIYKYTISVSVIFCIFSLLMSVFFCMPNSEVGLLLENISVGIFASSLVLIGSSFVGYFIEEKRFMREYYWKLLDLKRRAVVLMSIPFDKATWEEYYNAISSIYDILLGYFALVDVEFILFRKGEKAKKLSEIHSFLFEYSEIVREAELSLRYYFAEARDVDGNKKYTKEDLRKDLKTFAEATDDFKDSGCTFACYLDMKIREYDKMIR
ncbi:MAG: hypothetical protein IKB07_02975 [Lachnospiraceae bacterium]|nr:hypothetical protein [Lachnospiraceae bacterium]